MQEETGVAAEEIVRDFRRRRWREFVAVLLGLAALFLIYKGFNDPGFRFAGLSGSQLLWAALALVVAYLGHHLVNWRCPACKRYLQGGYTVSFCRHCGALFQGSGGLADREAQIELAVQEDVGRFRNRFAFHLLRGIALTVVGLVAAFALPGKGFGGLILLAGLALIAYAVHGLTVKARRHAEHLRNEITSSEG